MPGLRSPLAVLAVLGALALVLLSGCGSSDGGGDGTQAQTATTPAGSGPCQTVDAPAPRDVQKLRAPTQRLSAGRTWTVRMTTNCGAFAIRLDVARAPKTASSFAALVRRGFYDGLSFHRIAQGFVIQGGDPLGNGSGGPGYTVVERPPHNLQYVHGLVAMAKAPTEPNGASGSQFFIVTAQDAQLPAQYALVGRVVEGLDVVDAIGALPLQDAATTDGPPAEPVVIRSAKLTSG